MTPWSGNAPATPPGTHSPSPAPPAAAPARKRWPRGPSRPASPRSRQSTKAGAFSPFALHIARSDGQQELKGVDVTLPPGMTGKLAGIPYCPEAALAAAAATAAAPSRRELELPGAEPGRHRRDRRRHRPVAAPDRPARSSSQAPTTGRLSPWQSITPATAGPFDLGTVVVRVALFVDPETAQIHAVSDPIPHVFGGAQLEHPLDRRRPRPQGLHAQPDQLRPAGDDRRRCSGGGADPANPAAFSAFAGQRPRSRPATASALGFRPKLFTRAVRRHARRPSAPSTRNCAPS